MAAAPATPTRPEPGDDVEQLRDEVAGLRAEVAELRARLDETLGPGR